MIKTILIVAALLSVFWFPYPMTLILSFAASFFFPPVAFVVGLLSDLVYFVPGAYPVPLGVSLGLGLSLLAFVMRNVVRTRIMAA
ncbi:hypothetical protein L0Y34_00825 [Candidatus Parcubacteria bacterium]|nr:hypothetical protein [Candidatus Parcubacteria bacterium]